MLQGAMRAELPRADSAEPASASAAARAQGLGSGGNLGPPAAEQVPASSLSGGSARSSADTAIGSQLTEGRSTRSGASGSVFSVRANSNWLIRFEELVRPAAKAALPAQPAGLQGACPPQGPAPAPGLAGSPASAVQLPAARWLHSARARCCQGVARACLLSCDSEAAKQPHCRESLVPVRTCTALLTRGLRQEFAHLVGEGSMGRVYAGTWQETQVRHLWSVVAQASHGRLLLPAAQLE